MHGWRDKVERRTKLLLVDDQPLNIRILNEIFRGDHEIYMATDGERALDLAQTLLPDLILLDVVMPGVDGYEVCRRLKGNPLTSDIPVIFLTAMDADEDEAKGLDLGAVDYIGKPFHHGIVRSRVDTHITLKLQSELLKKIAMLDGLTGIPNRRAFDEGLVSSWKQACREGTWLGLIILDIDHFKRYNDYYGHQAGDQCLRRVAVALEAACRRPLDMVARYGGEEFACILPGTDLDGAATVAEALAASVRALNISHASSEVARNVTISQGVVSFIPAPGRDPVMMVRRADRQLYRAKEAGRAQICFETAPDDAAFP